MRQKEKIHKFSRNFNQVMLSHDGGKMRDHHQFYSTTFNTPMNPSAIDIMGKTARDGSPGRVKFFTDMEQQQAEEEMSKTI